MIDIEKLLEDNKVLLAASAVVYVLLGGPGPDTEAGKRAQFVRSACPCSRYRTAGAWRGKGSFGRGPFGPQARHRSK